MTAITSDNVQTVRIGARRQSRITRILLFALFVILAVVFFFPLYWMVISSLRPEGRIFVDAMQIIPNALSLDTYHNLFEQEPYGRWIINSITQTTGFAFTALILCTTGGYALAKFNFRFRKPLVHPHSGLTDDPLPPVDCLALPDDHTAGHGRDVLGARSFPWAASPIGIFFIRQYMLSIEDEMLNAARVDGASEYQIFFMIVLPNARPAHCHALHFVLA